MSRPTPRDANDIDINVADGEKAQQAGFHVETAEKRVDSMKNDTKAVDKRESLSAYFTIAAAAFGLISDGCKSAHNLNLVSRMISVT